MLKTALKLVASVLAAVFFGLLMIGYVGTGIQGAFPVMSFFAASMSVIMGCLSVSLIWKV